MDGLVSNPLTCALLLTCAREHRSAELAVAQKRGRRRRRCCCQRSPRCFVSRANVPSHAVCKHTAGFITEQLCFIAVMLCSFARRLVSCVHGQAAVITL